MKENASNQKPSKAFLGFFDILECLVYAIAIVVIVFLFIGRVSKVDGDSMYPTLKDKEFLFVADPFFAYQPKNGDIVVIHDANLGSDLEDKDHYTVPLVKRIIATENQTLSIDFNNGGKISINGGPYYDEDYAVYIPTLDLNNPATYDEIEFYFKYIYKFHTSGTLKNGVYTITVPKDHVFVMGDNRMNSGDSRAFGVVHENYIVGKAVFRILPLNKMGGLN